jgi:hypothetical protein
MMMSTIRVNSIEGKGIFYCYYLFLIYLLIGLLKVSNIDIHWTKSNFASNEYPCCILLIDPSLDKLEIHETTCWFSTYF